MQRLWIVLLPGLFCIQCKKNKDKTPPTVNIQTPLQNSTVSAGNYVHVTGTVSDDKKLQYVTIKVLSIDGNTQIADPVSLTITGNSMNIDKYILVGDVHTETGFYQVIVEAFDGTNKEKEYRDIQVNEIPKQFKKLVVVHKSGSGFSVDSLSGVSFIPFITRSTDFSGAAISNYHQQLYMAGYTQGMLEAWKLRENLPYWTIPGDIPSTTVPVFYFTEFNVGENALWESFATGSGGTLKSISNTGTVTKSIAMQANHYAACMLVASSDYVVAEGPKLSGGSALLTYYYKTGFGIDHTTTLPFNQPKKIFSLSSNELVVVGNNSGQAELRIYDSNTNGFWEQFDLPPGKCYDAVQLDANNYIIAHETGLLKFTHSPANLITLVSGIKAQTLTYDSFSGVLFAGESVFVREYDPGTGIAGPAYAGADSVKSILLHYNK